MGKYSKLTSGIIENVGGKENVLSVRHCVTRLRFKLVDESIANDEVLKNMDGVITIMKAMGEYMVVIGEHVADVYKEVCEQLGLEAYNSANKTIEDEKKKNIIQKSLDIIMGAMGPTLNLLCACGIIKGLLTLATLFGLATNSGIYLLMNAAGDCVFYFLPLILGFNLAKKLDMDPYLGFIIASALCYPTIQGVNLNLFGYVVKATYTGTFLPIVFSVIVAAPLYKLLNKHMPTAIKGFGVSLIVLVIIFPISFIAIGPVANLLGSLINIAFTTVLSVSPIIGGTIFAGVWQILVLFGIHGIPIMFAFMDLMQGHPNQLLAFIGFVCFAQIGAVLAIYFRTKNLKLKQIALPAFISGIFGVTEPAIYGVTLPRIKMFIVSCIGAASGGFVVGLFNMKMYTYAGMGVIGLLGLLNPARPQILPIIIAVVVSFGIAFALAFIMYKDDSEKEETKTIKLNKENIISPIDGDVRPLNESTDEAFASGVIGKGVVIMPTNGNVYAPCDGIVKTLFPTKHAIGIESSNGCEVLIHIGINTVRLEGKYFESYVKQDDKVKKGQLLVTFDKEKIEEEGYSLETPVIITNASNDNDSIEIMNEHVEHGLSLMNVCLKGAKL